MIHVERPGGDGAADPDLLPYFIDFYTTTFTQTFGTVYRAAGGDIDIARDATKEAYAVMLKLWRDNKKPEGDARRYVVG